MPPWLRGTLLLNGPALWDLPGGRLEHWFDGYGMWHALRIDGAVPRYRSRFSTSESYRRSRAAGTPVYGEFGTANPAGLITRLKAPQVTDNPAVVMSRHGERWFSVTETPYLTYFDPDTLATLERLDLGHQGEAMHLMSAHGFTLPDGSYLNVAIALGPRCECPGWRRGRHGPRSLHGSRRTSQATPTPWRLRPAMRSCGNAHCARRRWPSGSARSPMRTTSAGSPTPAR